MVQNLAHLGHAAGEHEGQTAQRIDIFLHIAKAGINFFGDIIEFSAGVISGSTALMADAGHNLSDVLGLAMAGGAAWLSRRQARGSLTYGYRKGTVLAALANALLLILATVMLNLAVDALSRGLRKRLRLKPGLGL